MPISHHFDTAGPMTKSVYDLAVLLDVLAGRSRSESYTTEMTGSWADIAVAVLDPDVWRFPEDWVKPVEGAEAQIVCGYLIIPNLSFCGVYDINHSLTTTESGYPSGIRRY